ncbi:hypothetical protein [Mesorhizobium sp.]|uniref:hypothetical protein n=1 Tax=Mesorhizobium sp. TaxID=1871066 RepID=UPI00345BEB50
MVDAALIQQCADTGLKPTFVERFIAEAGSPGPLAVTVRSGVRVVLLPRPSTPDEALTLVRQPCRQSCRARRHHPISCRARRDRC